MQRTVYVPRTSYDRDHVSHLVVPSYGIVNLNLVAGAASSKCYLPADAPKPAPAGGSDNFHFIPEYEAIEIHYEIDDKFAIINSAKFEVFIRFDNKPAWTLDLTNLGSDWWAHGKHVIKWDGRIVKPTAAQPGTAGPKGMTHDLTTIDLNKNMKGMRDGYFTLENPPYKLKLTLLSDKQAVGNPVVAWTLWHVLLHSLELEMGPEEAIPADTVNSARHNRDKDVRTRIVAKGGIPASGGSVEVVLLSNIFMTNTAEMDTDKFFTEYQNAWDDGPHIAVFAKVRLRDSADKVVKIDETPKGAVALGQAKFLWDWQDPAENVAAQQGAVAKPAAFITNAINYYNNGTDATRALSDHTYPQGDNCHFDRGGKRGPGAKPIFPEQTGYLAADSLTAGKFPFRVRECSQRVWAALSTGWTSGKLKGKTGVVFQPSRMGGDNYTLSVYLAYDKTAKDTLALDIKTEPLVAPDVLQKATGTFTAWREVHIARYITKKGTLPGLLPANLGGVQTNFQRAYVHVENKMGAANAYTINLHTLPGGAAIDYNTLIRGRLTGSGNILFTNNLATDAAADHASVDSMVLVRNYADFVKAVHQTAFGAGGASDIAQLAAALGATVDATAEAMPTWNGLGAPDMLATARLGALKSWLNTNGVQTKVKYSKKLDDLLFAIGDGFADDLELVAGGKSGGAAAPPGVTTVEFNFTNTYLRDLYTAGVGVAFWYGKAINPKGSTRDKCVIMFWLSRVDYFTHEFGHHFFLPHARYGSSGPPGGANAARHDDTDTGCFMSYSNARPAFCGLCQLRIRGWTATALDKISANNVKP